MGVVTLARTAAVRAHFADEVEAIDQMLRRNPHGDDRWIADHAAMLLHRSLPLPRQRIAERRLVLAGAIPKTDHAGLIRILALHAWHLGLEAAPERSIRLDDGRRVVPDLLVGFPGEPVRWVVEVKSKITNRSAALAAAGQVARYADAAGGEPIVTTYAAPFADYVEGVRFLSASAVRAMFAAEARIAKEAA